MSLAFTKMHGLGNDFIVVDARVTEFLATPRRLRKLADRRHGIGCDQILVIRTSRNPSCAYRYQIYNADGCEVEQCGNGVRCIGRWLSDRKAVDGKRLVLESMAGPVTAEVHSERVRVDMGRPRFDADLIPIHADAEQGRYRLEVDGESISIGAVSMGNPHAIIEVDQVADAPVERLGPALQAHRAFPDSVNVGFLQVIDSDHARLRVFERGVGETLACGTGACAAMVCARAWQRVSQRVEIELPGGHLTIEWPGGSSSVWMTGPADYAFEGQTDL